MERCVSYVASSSRSKPPVWQTGFFEPLRSGRVDRSAAIRPRKSCQNIWRDPLRRRRRNLGK